MSIPAAIPGEVWQVSAPSRWMKLFGGISNLYWDWRLLGDATTQSQEYLKSKGVAVAEIDLKALW